MSRIQKLHNRAMDLAEQADLAKLRGDSVVQQDLLRQAFELEYQAAQQVAQLEGAEPTRSILHRSAASLAIACENFTTAEQLIIEALTGNPPANIAEELKDLFMQLNLPHYLERRGVHLREDELQRLVG
ncbi:hypothetical protein [Vacuolonema iberomarrocanum]|uniref:hypothetical protein n=1 Tax=Vacuolonema iberomarrocanum TaxID=3454632 RepID=UPI001A06A1EA|nr:hypothetical protein [filamentous cyanobacterium LEGE 07170]